MLNRAKCKLCNDIVESLYDHHLVLCKCGEISVDGGAALKCAAKDWNNFIRIDYNDKEVPVKVHKEENSVYNSVTSNTHNPKITKIELIQMLKEMIKNIESLPEYVLSNPINHYDYLSLLLLLTAIFEDDCNSSS